MTNTETSESLGTVLWALGVNTGIAAVKGVAGLLSGSPSLLAEAAHSVVDTSTEVLLLGGELHARRRPRALYAWGLVAATNLFAVGGLYAAYEGLSSLVGGDMVRSGAGWAGLVVLLASAAMEFTSWRNAFRSLNASRSGRGWVEHLRTTTNTSAKAVLYEDSADIMGCMLAAVGLVLTVLTGSVLFDGVAALLIAVLLIAMAYELGSHNWRLLRA